LFWFSSSCVSNVASFSGLFCHFKKTWGCLTFFLCVYNKRRQIYKESEKHKKKEIKRRE
jgi:hypothetical protein